MKVWKDIVSGDEMVSDSYPHTLIYEDACLEVKSRLISKKKNEDFGISCKTQFFLFLRFLSILNDDNASNPFFI